METQKKDRFRGSAFDDCESLKVSLDEIVTLPEKDLLKSEGI